MDGRLKKTLFNFLFIWHIGQISQDTWTAFTT